MDIDTIQGFFHFFFKIVSWNRRISVLMESVKHFENMSPYGSAYKGIGLSRLSPAAGRGCIGLIHAAFDKMIICQRTLGFVERPEIVLVLGFFEGFLEVRDRLFLIPHEQKDQTQRGPVGGSIYLLGINDGPAPVAVQHSDSPCISPGGV